MAIAVGADGALFAADFEPFEAAGGEKSLFRVAIIFVHALIMERMRASGNSLQCESTFAPWARWQSARVGHQMHKFVCDLAHRGLTVHILCVILRRANKVYT